MGAIFKREWKAYMNNLYGFAFMSLLFCGVNALLIGTLINTRQPRIEYVLYLGCYVLILAIPFLCMRSMAEDKKTGVDRFYRSLPIRESAVVLGKFFALVAVFAIPVAIFALYPVILGAVSDIQYGGAYLALLHFFLIGVALIALCQFISALTRHTLLAGGIGLLASAALFALPFTEYILPEGLFLSILQNLSPIYHMEDVVQFGILNLRSLGVLLLYPILFVFLTLLVSGARHIRPIAVGSSVLAVVLAVNVVLRFLPFGVTEWSTDRINLVELPAETERFLSEMDEDVTVYWLCDENQPEDSFLGDWFVRLLERYEQTNPHIKVEKITDSEKVKEWEELGIYNYDLVFSSDLRASALGSGELFGYASTIINQMYDGVEYVFTAEEMGQMLDQLIAQYPSKQAEIEASVYMPTCIANAALTAALDYVTVEVVPNPYLLTGFGGGELPSGLQDALDEYGYGELPQLDLSRIDEIPADAGCVVLYAPLEDLGEKEAAVLQKYLSTGGSCVLTTSPNTWAEDRPRLQSLLTPYGLTALPGIVFESDTKYYVSSTDTLVPQVNSQHSLYSIYYEGKTHRMPWSHAIGISQSASAISIFSTSSSAVRKPSGGTNETIGSEMQYSVAAHAMRQIDGSTVSQVIWFGSTDAFSDSVGTVATGNYRYFIDSVDMLCGEYESPYHSIEGVSLLTEPMEEISRPMRAVLIVGVAAIIPLAVLGWGVAIWLKRRRVS